MRRADLSDLPELRDVVQDIEFGGRFSVAPFTREESQGFYRLRVEKAVLGQFDDACLILAEGMAGSESAFVERMTALGKKIGFKNE